MGVGYGEKLPKVDPARVKLEVVDPYALHLHRPEPANQKACLCAYASSSGLAVGALALAFLRRSENQQ